MEVELYIDYKLQETWLNPPHLPAKGDYIDFPNGIIAIVHRRRWKGKDKLQINTSQVTIKGRIRCEEDFIEP